jgi:hypothetical protein
LVCVGKQRTIGAIRYHLSVLNDAASSNEMKGNSAQVIRAWERVIRRVAAILVTNGTLK